MTIENELYGGNWQACSNCGVKDRADQLVRVLWRPLPAGGPQ